MARIGIIVNLFHPDELAGAALFTDLSIFLQAQGHDVRVTTTFSYYPAWKLRPEDRGVAWRDEVFQGIPLRRIRMYVPVKPTGLKRVLSDLSFFWGLLRHARWNDWTPDVILTASPMLSTCLAQRFIYRGRQIPRLIVVQDFVVDAALELGIIRLPLVPELLRGMERWAFKSAATLLTISQPMLDKLKRLLGGSRRCELVPNWIHSSLEQEIRTQNAARVQREAMTLFYSGNLGVKQGLPSFIRSFKAGGGGWKLRLHGGGGEMETLRTEITGVEGITLGGVMAEADYVATLRSVTACLITQRPGVGANFLPSKLLPALATATPVLAVCEASSPLGIEVREGGFGEVIEPGDDEALRRTLRRWQEDPGILRGMTEKAAIRSRRYSRETVLPRYEAELLRLIDAKQTDPLTAPPVG